MTNFSIEEKQRYSRHFLLEEIGQEGQLKLKQSRVLIVGLGGLGSPAALYLAAAGIGTLGLIEFDQVELSNLQRQILYSNDEVGQPKLKPAQKRLSSLNPDIEIITHECRLSQENITAIFEQYDIILDGTDNFSTRFLINDACVLLGKPNIHGSISKFTGQLSIFSHDKSSPCYRCLYPEPPPPGEFLNCSEEGVMGVLPGIIGTLQATEAIKLITSAGEPLKNQLLTFDALKMEMKKFDLDKDPACPVCGTSPTITEIKEESVKCSNTIGEILPSQLIDMIDLKTNFILIDVREPHEYNFVNLGGKLMPLSRFEVLLPKLENYAHKKFVVMCHHGGRSNFACQIMKEKGFSDVHNLTGGINRWALDVDQSLPRY